MYTPSEWEAAITNQSAVYGGNRNVIKAEIVQPIEGL
jgi:hypothetical protein